MILPFYFIPKRMVARIESTGHSPAIISLFVTSFPSLIFAFTFIIFDHNIMILAYEEECQPLQIDDDFGDENK